ncbi:MAG: VCBS repeat-containing protein [Cyanobacteriota bacterium]|nr:VCBS repeat-containing protein [Cyanobacteriota bacterium]
MRESRAVLEVDGLTLTGGDASGVTFSGNSLNIAPSAYNRLTEGESETIEYSYNIVDSNSISVAQTATITINGANGASDPFVITNPDPLSDLGRIVKGNGDFDGDGLKDFLYSAPGADGGDGELYVFFGNTDLNASTTQTIALNSPNPSFISVSIGDINGDGLDDIIVGDHTVDGNNGKTYVIYGNSSGSLATDVTNIPTGEGFTIVNNGSPFNLLGHSVSSGDIDGDGIDDVVIGATGANGGNGEVHVVFGQNTPIPSVVDINSPPTGTSVATISNSNPTSAGSQLGFSVATGNIIGDDKDDIIIGAIGDNLGDGKTYVVSGDALTSPFDLNTLDGNNGFALEGASGPPRELLGWKISSVGDINGDSYDDFGVTAPDGSSTQRTYVVFGKPSFSNPLQTIPDIVNGTGADGFYIDGLNNDDRQFEAISAAGDINGDGIDDFLIAEPYADTNGLNDSGQVYVVYGRTDGFGTSLDLSSLEPNDGFSVDLDDLGVDDLTGLSVSDAGDVNGDDLNDFLIGAPGANGGDGKVYVVLGEDTNKPIPETTVDFFPNYIYRNEPDREKRLIGENHKFVVTFDNVASPPSNTSAPGNIGYAPFIDLFLDTTGVDGDDGFEFVGVKALADDDLFDGINLICYDPDIPMATIYEDPTGSGNLLVDHPYAGTIDVTSLVPPGIGADDTLYVIPLITDSFAPDQEPLKFEVEVKISKNADYRDPTDPNHDPKLTVATRGGFRYGANPTLDPAPIFDETATDNSLEPQLFRVRKFFSNGFDNNHPLPSEIITGENFGGRYNIVVDVAPGQTIETLNLEDHLPDDILYSGNVSTNAIGSSYTTPGVPGGVVTAEFGNVTGANGTDAFFSFDVEVGRLDENGNPVLDPDTADDERANNDAFVTAVSWDPYDDRDPTLTNLTEDLGDIDETIIETAIGIQQNYSVVVDNNAPGFSPGDVIEYSFNFAVSDYFAFEDVIINNTFSDGQLFDASFIPTFTVDEHNSNIAGSFDPSNYSVVNPGATGTITFDLSNQLVASGSDAQLLGGRIGSSGGYTGTFGATTGTLKFRTIVQEDFTTSFPSGDSSVDNGDRLSNSVAITGDVLDVDTLTPTGFEEADGDGFSFRLPRGRYADDYEVSVYAIDGILGAGNGTVEAGDDVTYRIKYTLPFADIENLNFTSELSFPAFDVSDLDISTVLGFGGIPALNTISYGPEDTLSTLLGGSISPTLSVNNQSNLLNIDYGTFDDSTTPTAGPVTIELLYTLEVDEQQIQNNLSLTNLVYQREGSTNAGSRQFYKLATLEFAKPELKITKGVVATSEEKAVFSEFFPVVGSPENISFTDPGTPGPRFSGVINSDTLANTNYFDSDVTADLNNLGSGDLVTFAVVVENIGLAPNGAFDVLIKDALPTGFTIPSNPEMLNLKVTDGTGANIDYTLTGMGAEIQLVDSAGMGAISAYDATSGKNVAIITFDLEVDDNLPDGTILTSTATLEEYAASEGGAKFLPGSLALTDDARVQTQPYLQEQFETFLDNNTTDISGETFNALDYLEGDDLTYQVTVEKDGFLVYDSTIPLNRPLNPFEPIDLANFDFTFKDVFLGAPLYNGNYTVELGISDADPNNNPSGLPYDVQDSFAFEIEFNGSVTIG